MPLNDNYSHRAYNKNVVIELPDYQPNHHPLDGTEGQHYIGREGIEQQFLQYLESKSRRGAYLVTGYRGMGKTSFVNKVIRQFTDKRKGQVERINLSFSQRNLNKEDILKQIVNSLILYLENKDITIRLNNFFSASRLFRLFLLVSSVILFVTILPIFSEIFRRKSEPFFYSIRHLGDSPLVPTLVWLVFGLLLSTVGIALLVRLIFLIIDQIARFFTKPICFFCDIKCGESRSKDLYSRLLELKMRSHAALTEENNLNSTTFFPSFPIPLFARKSRNYPMLREKDIENDLIRIIEDFKRTELIFVFDELDKVDASIQRNESAPEASPSPSYNGAREQKENIMSILASLKFFMSQSKAKFIFIAGREMFDAALADIADRQNYLGSIFHHVLYVDSFLKDTPMTHNTGLPQRVEDYLERILMQGNDEQTRRRYQVPSPDGIFLRRYFKFLTDQYMEPGHLCMDDVLKIIYSLQMFIIYVSYRSNGSPKKMAKVIEEHIVRKDKADAESFKNVWVSHSPGENPLVETVSCLELTYDSQYRNAYIAYLFRPFLMNYSTYAKRLSDKILVDIPFMIDHLLKFHAFAFSRQNLELLPEVISPNRTHLVRNLIFDLINYFSENHITNIEMGLFEYRFKRKTSDELKFISKTFEEDSAAFNFSLDEMHSVKSYLQNKIEQLRAAHAVTLRETTTERTLYSLSFLQSLMGDAYYFDKEYDLAVLSYLDSIQSLRYKENAVNTFENRISVMRLLLKIGLMYELMKKYDMALGYFFDALNYYKAKFQKENDKLLGRSESAVSMQLFFKSMLSVMNMIEKKISNGLTQGNLEEFNKLIETRIRPSGTSPLLSKEDDDKNPRINLELAHYYTELGTILFYKNIIPIRSRNQIPNQGLDGTSIKKEALIAEVVFSPFSANDLLDIRILYDSKDYRPTLASLGEYKRALTTMLSAGELEKIEKHRTLQAGQASNSVGSDAENVSFATLLYFAARKIKSYKNVYAFNYLQICADTFCHIGNSLFSLTVKRLDSPTYLVAYAKYYAFKVEVYKQLQGNLSNFDDKQRRLYTLQQLQKSNEFILGNVYFSKLINEELEAIKDNLKVGTTGSLTKVMEICEPRPLKYWDDITYDYFQFLNGTDDNIFCHKLGFCEIQFIVFLYYLSARYFSKAGLNHNFSQIVKKIFQVVRNTMERRDRQTKNARELKEVVDFFENTLLKLVLESASRSSYSTDRPQMQKYKYYEELDELGEHSGNYVYHPEAFRRYNYFNLSNGPEVKEAIFYFALLKVKTSDYPALDLDRTEEGIRNDKTTLYDYLNNNIPELRLISPYNVPSSQYSRLLELDLHTRINYIMLKKITEKYGHLQNWEDNVYGLVKRSPERVTPANIVRDSGLHEDIYYFLCELVASSVFMLVQQIKVYSIFQVNPLLNNAQLAKYHVRLGRWLKYYQILHWIDKVFVPERSNSFINQKIDDLFGNSFSRISLDTTSQFQIALQLLHKAKQYHSNGVAFKREMENKVYLEGDYSDITYNFGLALERHKVNSGKIREEIRLLEKEVAGSPLLEYTSFTNPERYPNYNERVDRETE